MLLRVFPRRPQRSTLQRGLAGAIAAVLIDRWTERHVDDAALDVDGDEAPDVDAGAILPAVAAHVSLNFSPACRRTNRNVHTTCRMHVPGAHRPAAPRGGFSWLRLPVMIVDGRRRAQADGPLILAPGVFMSMLHRRSAGFRSWHRASRAGRYRCTMQQRTRISGSSTPRVDGLPAGTWKNPPGRVERHHAPHRASRCTSRR